MTTTTDAPTAETFEFQAETRQLLEIVIHSLYSKKEIFLRELISNASDAIDRLRFEALTTPELLSAEEAFEIRLETDKEARTFTIHDNGIGMSRDEVIANIGTIAKSGTRELMAQIEASTSSEAVAELIGQFGVGFYSAFMVADEVVLLTRRAGEEGATEWSSKGDGAYEIRDATRGGRGTSITLKLKPENKDQGIDDFTDFFALQRVVKRYSDFVVYPIRTKDEREEPETDAAGNQDPTKMRTVIEDKTLNSMKPIWTRADTEVKLEEYHEFYKHISHDWTEPFDYIRLKAEGRIEYTALLFLPKKAPYDIYYVEQTYGLQLYVRKVLIMDNCQELLPKYLRFVKGVVDSADLPLNISREMIQQDRHIGKMRRWITRKVLDYLRKMAKDNREKYIEFWREFGPVIKEGVNNDFDNKDRIVPLLYVQSSHDPEALTSLDEYLERMPEDQDKIYFLTGETRKIVESSPHLEAFHDKGYEVLYLVDPVDEMVAQSIQEHEGKSLQSVGKGTIELGSAAERKAKETELAAKRELLSPLLERMQTYLDEWVREVRLSSRLVSSPVCLVGGDHDLSPNLERLMREAQAGNFEMPAQKRIMEVNPTHDLFTRMQAVYEADLEDPRVKDYAQLLLGYGLLAEGSELHDAATFNRLVVELMVQRVGEPEEAADDGAATPVAEATDAPPEATDAPPEATDAPPEAADAPPEAADEAADAAAETEDS